MDILLLKDISLILGFSIFILFFCHRLKIPVIVGFLVTGVVTGPYAFGLIQSVGEVKILAEIGIILLLFTIGIEFSLQNLVNLRRLVLLGGTLQVVLTILVVFLLARLFGLDNPQSILVGFIVSLSSTAIVLKQIQDRSEIDTPHGRVALSILIFQDLIIVIMFLVFPILGGEGIDIGSAVSTYLFRGVTVIITVFVLAKWIVPWLLYYVAKTKSRELFLLCVIFICFSIALGTSLLGLSLALGAFIAGLIISQSEYSNQALGNIVPFRDVFSSFFFISIGMLLNIDFLMSNFQLVLVFASGVLLLKFLLALLAVILLGFPFRISILVGLSICQIGEFSFILLNSGIEHGFFSETFYQLFLAASVLTMTVTSFIIIASKQIADFFLKIPIPKKILSGIYPLSAKYSDIEKEKLSDHLVIVGLGVNGRNVSKAAKVAGIPYVVIEINPETVRKERKAGEPIFYGDATSEAVLQQAGIKTARVVVIVIADPAATRAITFLVRKLNEKILIIARTRYVQEVEPLIKLGADEVIPEEYETSIIIFTRVLSKYLIPKEEITRFIAEIRSYEYEMLRELYKDTAVQSDLKLSLPNIEINTISVEVHSSVAGKTINQIKLRKKHGVMILAIKRGKEIISNPDSDTKLLANDMIIVLSKPEQLLDVLYLFEDSKGEKNEK